MTDRPTPLVLYRALELNLNAELALHIDKLLYQYKNLPLESRPLEGFRVTIFFSGHDPVVYNMKF